MMLTTFPQTKYATTLCVRGALDGETYGQFVVEAQHLLAHNTRLLIVELSECEYMSSAGLLALTSLFKQMRELTRNETSATWATKNVLERAGELGPPHKLVIVNPRPAVERVLELAAMTAYIPMYPDVASALNAEQ